MFGLGRAKAVGFSDECWRAVEKIATVVAAEDIAKFVTLGDDISSAEERQAIAACCYRLVGIFVESRLGYRAGQDRARDLAWELYPRWHTFRNTTVRPVELALFAHADPGVVDPAEYEETVGWVSIGVLVGLLSPDPRADCRRLRAEVDADWASREHHEQFKHAVRLCADGQPRESIDQFNAVIAQSPPNSKDVSASHLELALAYERTGDLPQAHKSSLAAVESGMATGQGGTVLRAAWQLSHKHQDLRAALSAYQHVLATGDSRWVPQAWPRIALVLDRLGDLSASADAYRQATVLGPPEHRALYWCRLADVLSKLGDPDARSAYSTAINIGNGKYSSFAWEGLARIQDHHGDHDGAAASREAAARIRAQHE